MSTRRERLARKLEQRAEWADKARTRSDAAFAGAAKRAEAIPFGQPVLIGHHSERRDRNYRAKIHAGMDRGLAEQRKAEHHEARARGLSIALDRSIFGDDPDAVEKLEAKMAALEADRAAMKAANAAFRKSGRSGVVAILGEAQAAEVFWRASYTADTKPFPSYCLSNTGAEIRRCKLRIAQIEATRKREGEAVAAGGVVVRRHVEHNWCTITFAEKPAREVLAALRAAGYGWSKGSWHGRLSKLPEEVERAEEEAKAEAGECLCSDADAYECVQHEAERREAESSDED